MKSLKFLCYLGIASVISCGASAQFSITNMPLEIAQKDESGPILVQPVAVSSIIYVQLMSLKSTSLDELVGQFDALTRRGYSVCSRQAGAWRKVLVGPYATAQAAQVQVAELQQHYPDAYIVEEKACSASVASLEFPVAQTNPMKNTQSGEPKTLLPEVELMVYPAPVNNLAIESSIKPSIKSSINAPQPLRFNTHQGEALRHALSRFAQRHGYHRVVMDINAPKLGADQMKALINTTIQTYALSDIRLAQLYSNIPPTGLYLHSVDEVSQRSLVVTDQVYREHQSLTVFNVEAGSLLTNIKRLSHHYGWKLAQGGWQLPIDYQVKFAYPLLVHDLFGGLVKLLQRHPVQAQMMQHSRQLAFVARPLLTSNPSQ